MEQYVHKWYKNLLEDEKLKFVEYRKNIIKWEKSLNITIRDYYFKK